MRESSRFTKIIARNAGRKLAAAEKRKTEEYVRQHLSDIATCMADAALLALCDLEAGDHEIGHIAADVVDALGSYKMRGKIEKALLTLIESAVKRMALDDSEPVISQPPRRIVRARRQTGGRDHDV